MGARQAHGKAWAMGEMAAAIFGQYNLPQRTACPTSSAPVIKPEHPPSCCPLTVPLTAPLHRVRGPQGESEMLELSVWESVEPGNGNAEGGRLVHGKDRSCGSLREPPTQAQSREGPPPEGGQAPAEF